MTYELENIKSQFSNPKSGFTIKVGFQISESNNSDFRTTANPKFIHHYYTHDIGVWMIYPVK